MWCAVTDARQFLQPTYGKAIENKTTHNMVPIDSAAVIAFALLTDMICVLWPNQPQQGDG